LTLLAGRYELQRPLGHGGMAVVELAHDVELDRTVAVKLLAENLTREDEFRRRFLREAQVAARLAHPNVVRIYDVGEGDGRPYIVMEYVEGETLAAILAREGQFEARRAAEVCVQASAGLGAAHAIGLVHRDVKPQNLLVRNSDGVVKVADFGVARLDDGTRMTLTGTVLGTTPYLAPEQVLGQPATPAADVYSLGAVLYELLTGVPPRRAETLAELGARLEEPVAPVRELAPETPLALERIVMRCLARHPHYRPQSAAAVASELAMAVPDAGTTPVYTAITPKPASERGTRVTQMYTGRRLPRGRRTALLLGLPAAIAAIAVTAALLTTVGGSSRPPQRERPASLVVRPVPHSNDAVVEARNLARWLRQNSE
jgi:eukaryotic-like serine/threonine-protein kinase